MMTANNARSDFSIALAGSGGAGAITAGNLLLQLAGEHGLYGLMKRSFGPQIRGGEAASLLRFAQKPPGCMDDGYDVFLAIDWRNAERFADEIQLKPGALVLADPASGEVPEIFRGQATRQLTLPLKSLAAEIPGGRENMIALGALAAVMGLDAERGQALAARAFQARGDVISEGSRQAFSSGFQAMMSEQPGTWSEWQSAIEPSKADGLWSISGNEGCALGALRGGIRFAAAYPITPASDILEWLAPRLEQLGGSLLQAEDELASINMVIGASFGGIPSMTATSGPGLSLMLEGLGLAVASETPALVINVQRGGPSTGIPTKSEQADLDQALHGLHGDAPHLVLAVLDHIDCILTTEWAARLAERLQTVAIVLSDQYLAQSRVVSDPPQTVLPPIKARKTADNGAIAARRYQLTDDGISAMSTPGMAGGAYTADGLEHDETGKPSTAAVDHVAQLNKRRDKIEQFDYGHLWAQCSGDDEPAVILTWGSSSAVAGEAAERLNHLGTPTRVIAMRLLAPSQPQRLAAALAGAEQVLVLEQSHSRQFYRYLRAHYDLPENLRVLARSGPALFTPGEVVAFMQAWSPAVRPATSGETQ